MIIAPDDKARSAHLVSLFEAKVKRLRHGAQSRVLLDGCRSDNHAMLEDRIASVPGDLRQAHKSCRRSRRHQYGHIIYGSASLYYENDAIQISGWREARRGIVAKVQRQPSALLPTRRVRRQLSGERGAVDRARPRGTRGARIEDGQAHDREGYGPQHQSDGLRGH